MLPSAVETTKSFQGRDPPIFHAILSSLFEEHFGAGSDRSQRSCCSNVSLRYSFPAWLIVAPVEIGKGRNHHGLHHRPGASKRHTNGASLDKRDHRRPCQSSTLGMPSQSARRGGRKREIIHGQLVHGDDKNAVFVGCVVRSPPRQWRGDPGEPPRQTGLLAEADSCPFCRMLIK